MRLRPTLLMIFLALVALLAPAATPASAGNVSERGYRWSLGWDFSQSFDGQLKIEVGPWKNGDLTDVEETSTTPVRCQRLGAVQLLGGVAVFDGGYLTCELDLAAALLYNHGIKADEIDSYHGFTVRTVLASTAANVAPLVSHPDVAYQIDFSQPSSVAMRKGLITSAGAVQAEASFPGLLGGNLRTYSYVYGCPFGGGICNASFYAGAEIEDMPLPGAGPVQFHTGPTTLLIGGDGATTFLGGIDDLIIDPGNTYPRPT